MNDNQIKLLGKIQNLQEIMFDLEWSKDGKNMNQQYKFITEGQYKDNFKKAVKEAGLIWEVENTDVEFIGQVSQSMHLVFARFIGRLIDPETGEYREYKFSGSGSDTTDKALYKAYTGGLKYFLADNFLVTENNDPENDQHTNNHLSYVPEEKREKIKNDLTSGQASDMQVDVLQKLFKELLSLDPSSKEYVQKILKDTSGLKKIGKKECEDLIIEIGNKIQEVKK